MRFDFFIEAAHVDGQGTESWLCIDCGVNTAPGVLGAAETLRQLEKQRYSPQYVDSKSEVYNRCQTWASSGAARLSDYRAGNCWLCRQRLSLDYRRACRTVYLQIESTNRD